MRFADVAQAGGDLRRFRVTGGACKKNDDDCHAGNATDQANEQPVEHCCPDPRKEIGVLESPWIEGFRQGYGRRVRIPLTTLR